MQFQPTLLRLADLAPRTAKVWSLQDSKRVRHVAPAPERKPEGLLPGFSGMATVLCGTPCRTYDVRPNGVAAVAAALPSRHVGLRRETVIDKLALYGSAPRQVVLASGGPIVRSPLTLTHFTTIVHFCSYYDALHYHCVRLLLL